MSDNELSKKGAALRDALDGLTQEEREQLRLAWQARQRLGELREGLLRTLTAAKKGALDAQALALLYSAIDAEKEALLKWLDGLKEAGGRSEALADLLDVLGHRAAQAIDLLETIDYVVWGTRGGTPGSGWQAEAARDAVESLAPEALGLTGRERKALLALLRLGAVDEARKATTDRLVEEIDPLTDVGSYKRVVSRLHKAGLVATRKRRGGGVWLTADGKRAAERLVAK